MSAVVLTSAGTLVNINPRLGTVGSTAVPITLPAGSEGYSIIGMDFRPRDGELIGLGRNLTTGRLYSIDPATGMATLLTGPDIPLGGMDYGVDFNPGVGVFAALRIVGDNEDNLRIAFPLDGNGDTYTVNTDTTLTPAGNVGFAAYTNSFDRSGGDFLNTSLYVLDTQRNVLQTQGSVDSAPISPNSGRLTDVGALGVSFNDRGGFDIEGNTGVALATLNVDNATNSRLYSINLRSGAASCLNDLDLPGAQWAIGLAIPNGNAPDVFAVRGGNELVTFTINSPGDSVVSVGTITSLNGGETVVGLDFRPATDELFALTNSGRLLQIDPGDASAIEINANVASAVTTPTPMMLNGTRFGVDFNPAANALRIVSDLAQNLRVPTNLALPALVDGTLGYRQGVTAAGYTNPDPGATGTELFVIDTQNDRLFLQSPPNDGILVQRGLLGVGDVSSVNGYDVVQNGMDNEHYALLTVAPGDTNLYTINPADGAATQVGMTLAAGLYKGLTVELGVALGARDLTLLREDAAGDVLVSATLMVGVLMVGSETPITGLATGDRLIGMDNRTTAMTVPADNGLYAVGRSGQIYRIDPATAVATSFATLSFPPPPAAQALAGTNFGVDFNPRADLLRIVSDTGQNLRVNLQAGRMLPGADGVAMARAAGFAFVDGTTRLASPLPEAISTAYRGAVLPGVVPLDFQYIIDARDNSLGRVVVPNDGAIDRVGPLNITLDDTAAGSFDISGASGDTLKLAALVPEGEMQSVLYTINLQTGAATMVGPIGGVNDPLVTAISGPILR